MAEITINELSKMGLHETKVILEGSRKVMRVPGGWIYIFRETTISGRVAMSTTFVPQIIGE